MASKKDKKQVNVATGDDVRSAKNAAVNVALEQIRREYGAGSIMKLGSAQKVDVDVIPTGAINLDVALGVGGIPRGRIIEIYGPESSGKTTLALHIVAEAQKKGGQAAIIDAEHALDPEYASQLGVDVDNLFVSQPDYGEQALEILETLVRSGGLDIIVVDSVAALTPKAEIEGDMGDSHMGLQARLMSQALRKITGIAGKTNTTVIFLNQIRMKIGVMFGNPETTTGGNALKFYASVRMDIRQLEKITQGEDVIGHVRRVKIVKNKVAPPFKEVKFNIIYPRGIDKESALLEAALDLDIIQKSGAWFKMGDEQLGQGQEAVRTMMIEDDKFREKIEKMVREKAFSKKGMKDGDHTEEMDDDLIEETGD